MRLGKTGRQGGGDLQRDFRKLEGYFDIIVVDAPCSGSGLFRRDPAAISEWSAANVELCSQRQRRILSDVLPSLREEGILVYSTCSFAPEENEAVIDSLLKQRDDASIEPVKFGYPGLVRYDDMEFASSLRNTRRLYPHLHDTTGFFIAKVRFH